MRKKVPLEVKMEALKLLQSGESAIDGALVLYDIITDTERDIN